VSSGQPLFCLEAPGVAPELARRIELEPDDLESLLVYADTLQEAGDARGRLVTLHHQWETTGDPGLEAEFESYLQAHERELFGGFAFMPKEWRRSATFTWRHGFIDAIEMEVAEIRYYNAQIGSEVLAAVLGCPVARFVRSLVFDAMFSSVAPSVLVSSRCRSVRHIDFYNVPPDVSLLSELPNLRSLTARYADANPEINLPRLEELRMHGTGLLAPAARSTWPALRSLRLEVKLRLHDRVLEQLERLLSAEKLPALERLAIRDTREPSASQAGLDPLVPLLLSSGLLPQLSRLELRGHLTNQGIRTLWERREALAHLESLRIDPRRTLGREARRLLAELGAEQCEQS
jgi:uncharacterized protein (TIGR02996 family)